LEIILTYEGRIPSKASSKEAVWDMRRSFDRQLKKLWGKEPFDVLKKWEEAPFGGGAPNFLVHRKDQLFVPYYGHAVGVGVSLDIRLLTGMPDRQAVINAGDLDNRIKRIIDALQAPTQNGELLDDLEPDQRWHCLVDNDSAVLGLQARLGPYLGSADPSISFAVIVARPVAIRVTIGNIGMLY
jgi:hypothetical protein